MKPSRCNNPTKWQAREAAIFAPARKLGFPLRGDYVTLCNVQYNEDHYEYRQFKDNLHPSSKAKFVGIDNSKRIITQNKSNLPHDIWLHGDMLEALRSNKQLINPGIVHLDTTYTAPKALRYVAKLANWLLVHYKQQILFTITYISTNPYSGETTELSDAVNIVFDAFDICGELWDNMRHLKSIEYDSGPTLMCSMSFLIG